MEVFERRRLKLAEILKEMSAAELSRKSGIAASFVKAISTTSLQASQFPTHIPGTSLFKPSDW